MHRTIFPGLGVITGSLNFAMGGTGIDGKLKAEAIYVHVYILQRHAYNFQILFHPILSYSSKMVVTVYS